MPKQTPPVKTQTGLVAGRYEEDEIAVFKGIPYAEAPVGELRWRPPRPPIPWSGTRKAEKPSARAWQQAADFELFMDALVEGQGWNRIKTEAVKLMLKVAPAAKESEDCLYLNVRTPSLGREAKLPVMVWIHGGDHQDGSASDIFYQSNALAKRGVVLVVINYRLGLIGYLVHPHLRRESEHGVSGNYGTLDQIAALEWVQENVTSFGGDPDNVTIFGESAGGESVAHMLTSPLARGLFHKAILQSPANSGQMMLLRRPFINHPAGESLGLEFAGRFVPPGADQIDALRQISPNRMYALIRKDRSLQHFYPVIDGHVLVKSPFQAFLDGEQQLAPLLLGSNADEGTLIYPLIGAPLPEHAHEEIAPDRVAAIVREAYGDDAPRLFEIYPGLEQGSSKAQIDILGDELFGSRTNFYAHQAAKQGQPAYFYHFTRTPPSPKQTAGAFHAAEVSFVHGSPIPLFDNTQADKALTQVLGTYWTEFAKSGDPNGGALPKWPRYSVEVPQQMVLGTGSALGAADVDRLPQYEIMQRKLIRQIQALRRLREDEVEVTAAD